MKKKNEKSQATILDLKIKKVTYLVLIILFTSLAIALSVYLMYLGNLPKSKPAIIEIKSTGEATYYPNGEKLLYAGWTPDINTCRQFIIRFITDSRSLENKEINGEPPISINSRKIYSALTQCKFDSPAFSTLVEYYKQYSSVENPNSYSIVIPKDTITVYQENKNSKNVWRVGWEEITYDKDGKLILQKKYEGVVTTTFILSKDEETLRKNPIGMYITDFTHDQSKEFN